MSSQQFPRHGLPASSGGTPQISAATAAANLVSVSQPLNAQGRVFTGVAIKNNTEQYMAWKTHFKQTLFSKGMQRAVGMLNRDSMITYLEVGEL